MWCLLNFYYREDFNFESIELTTGDKILFVEGEHGFNKLEEIDIIGVKQGPYFGRDKDERVIE